MRFRYNSDMAISLKLRHSIVKSWQSLKTDFLKFEPLIKIPMLANYTFFTIITFNKISSFA